MIENEELRTTKEAAKFLKCHPGTLPNWRRQGVGPKYLKLERKVLYRLSDLKSYMSDNTINPNTHRKR